jgi:hypothetical protein
VSATLRISLIFHEVKARIGAELPVAVGEPIPFLELAGFKDRQALADHLREITYGLAIHAPEPPKENPARKIITKLKSLKPRMRAA